MCKDGEDKKVLVFPGSERPVAVPEVIVLAAQRPYRAYKAHQSGKSWDEVAEQEKYPSAQSARADVRRYLTEGRALVTEWSRAEQLAIELAIALLGFSASRLLGFGLLLGFGCSAGRSRAIVRAYKVP